jgi:hypothetical protein
MHPITTGALLALQCFHVLFLALHDWIPLGTLIVCLSVSVNSMKKKNANDGVVSLITAVRIS